MSKQTIHPRVTRSQIFDLIETQIMIEVHYMDRDLIRDKVVSTLWNLEFDIEDSLMADDLSSFKVACSYRESLKSHFPRFWSVWLFERFGTAYRFPLL